jgi:hypothetical protein
VAQVHCKKLLDEPWRRFFPELISKSRVHKALVKEGITTVGELCEATRSGLLRSRLGFGNGSQNNVDSALRGLGIDPTKQP